MYPKNFLFTLALAGIRTGVLLQEADALPIEPSHHVTRDRVSHK